MTNFVRRLWRSGVWVRERQVRTGNWHGHALVDVGFEIRPGFPFEEVAKHNYRNVNGRVRDLWKQLREKAPRSYATAERRFDENEWYPWPYNEAIGWIQISVRGEEIKGALYFVKAKKVRRRMSKRFHWAGELFEIDVLLNDSSTKIYKTICAELDKFRSEWPYRKWYVDTEAFRNIAPFVDWRRLVIS